MFNLVDVTWKINRQYAEAPEITRIMPVNRVLHVMCSCFKHL